MLFVIVTFETVAQGIAHTRPSISLRGVSMMENPDCACGQ